MYGMLKAKQIFFFSFCIQCLKQIFGFEFLALEVLC